ncbi:signal peptidase I [Arthrobacter sulfonylureivorans]|uniref:Signal peptidase I n=1 Tax=Arthrobacter sulfonylureivorans TaxID=2486855 RepID=A0ABY3W5L2_9MICC|nr:signal peptidase I [Arthrobacter sulfonylureivorans]UNK45549.1 signal peptidase I [Arthrobacter sulfonylureivorans]
MAHRQRTLRQRLVGGFINMAAVLGIAAAAAILVPGLLGMERYVITGTSMSGTFERGSLAFEEPVPVGQLRVGDVITYMPPPDSGLTQLVTHRIISIDEDAHGLVFRTKGDANSSQDPWEFRLQEPMQPRVVATVPYVGHAFIALADKSQRMLIIGVPAGALAAFFLVDFVRGLRPRPQANPAQVGHPA